MDNVFILAGLKPNPPPPVAEENEALAILRNLTATVRNTVLTMLRALATDQPRPAAIQDPAVQYIVDEPWIRELIDELRQVPDEWRPEAVRQIQFIARIANRPDRRIIGEEDETQRQPAD